MPIPPFPAPYGFKSYNNASQLQTYNAPWSGKNQWGPAGLSVIGNVNLVKFFIRYSDYVNTDLTPYLQNNNLTPPYIIGSQTIHDPTGASPSPGVFNYKPKMASPYYMPTFEGNATKLQTFAGDENYNKIKVWKVAKELYGYEKPSNYFLGANTYMGLTQHNHMQDGTLALSKGIKNSSNILPEDALKRTAYVLGLGAVSGFTGSPRLVQLAKLAIPGKDKDVSFYSSVPFNNLNKLKFVPYQDFRSRRGWDGGDLIGKRLDGGSAAIRNAIQLGGRGVATPAAYAAASALIGAYSIFNLEATYGWGEHGTKFALRNDFTARSHVATVWGKLNQKRWVKPGITDPVAKVTAFRGDKVSVIDFKSSTRANVYRWVPNHKAPKSAAKGSVPAEKNAFGAALEDIGAALDKLGGGKITQDFIKFYFAGPELVPWNKKSEDDVMVFRAIITSLTDSYNPQWSPIQFIGRADPSYNYTSYARDINIDFTVYATDRDELKPIWRKLNALASYTAPEYDASTIGLKGPWIRFTLGDLFLLQPIIITSLYYTMQDADTTWEINIEKDPQNMEVPMKIQVSLGATVITDYLPQKGGKMYTLAKRFTKGEPKIGDDNWLSDARGNSDAEFRTEKQINKLEELNNEIKGA